MSLWTELIVYKYIWTRGPCYTCNSIHNMIWDVSSVRCPAVKTFVETHVEFHTCTSVLFCLESFPLSQVRHCTIFVLICDALSCALFETFSTMHWCQIGLFFPGCHVRFCTRTNVDCTWPQVESSNLGIPRSVHRIFCWFFILHARECSNCSL